MMKRILLPFCICTTIIANTQTGNVGIGITNPLARLHVADSNVLFVGPSNPPPPGFTPTPISGPGSRLMWYARRSAFRAGRVDGNMWDGENLGNYSFAAGRSPIASGESSIALGDNAEATGSSSFASGQSTTASNFFSTAMGNNTISSGTASFAAGQTTQASGNGSVALGVRTIAKSEGGVAVGLFNNSDDNPGFSSAATDRIFQIGNGEWIDSRKNALTVLRNGNIGIGSSLNPGFKLNFENTEGDKISLFGQSGPHYGFGIAPFTMLIHSDFANSDIAFGYGQSGAFTERMRIKGTGNVGIGNSNPNAPLAFAQQLGKKITLYPGVTGDVGFAVQGNQLLIYSDNPSASVKLGYDQAGVFTNNFEVFGNGNGWIRGTLAQASDATLKKDIVRISNALSSLQQINGYSYFWIDEANSEKQFGVLAQEVEKYFPELVKQNSDGKLSVNYSGLIPVIIEGMKEQSAKIDSVMMENAQLKKDLAELKKLVLEKLK